MSEKIYLWPVYNAGKINKVQGPLERETGDSYLNPLSEEMNKQRHGLRNQTETLYTSHGNTYNNNVTSTLSGSLFSALA